MSDIFGFGREDAQNEPRDPTDQSHRDIDILSSHLTAGEDVRIR